MNRTRISIAGVLVLMLVLATPFVTARGGGLSLDWFTLDSGGGQSIGGAYEVHGSIGQPDAAQSSGGQFSVEGGFWHGVPTETPTPTPTNTPTNTPTPTDTPTNTPTDTPTDTPTEMPTETPTPTNTPTTISTETPTSTNTSTATSVATETPTLTPATPTATNTPTPLFRSFIPVQLKNAVVTARSTSGQSQGIQFLGWNIKIKR